MPPGLTKTKSSHHPCVRRTGEPPSRPETGAVRARVLLRRRPSLALTHQPRRSVHRVELLVLQPSQKSASATRQTMSFAEKLETFVAEWNQLPSVADHLRDAAPGNQQRERNSNRLNLKRRDQQPLNAPITVTTARAARIAGYARYSSEMAADKSIPPVAITLVIPIATSIIGVTCTRMLRKSSTSAKFGGEKYSPKPAKRVPPLLRKSARNPQNPKPSAWLPVV